jgi:hypothetical protein
MHNLAVKTFVVAVALSLTNVSGIATASEKTSLQEARNVTTIPLKKPCSYDGLIQLNQQIYYSGDKLALSLILPEELKALLREDAEAHILVYFPDGQIEPFSVVTDGQLLEATIESADLAAGNYQLALVFTQAGGDAVKIKDWYNGFAGLISFNRLKISDQIPGADSDDNDGDGLIDKLVKDESSKVEAISAVCVEEGALTRRAEADKDVIAFAAKKSSPLATFELKPAVAQALKVLSELRIVADTYYSETGRYPLTFDEISPSIPTEIEALVTNIQFNAKNPFYYQFTLNNDLDPALAGKTLKCFYEPTSHMWHCKPGSPNGLDTKYLPFRCR